MEYAGFEEIGAYILKRSNTVAQYITTRPILELYKKTVQIPGPGLLGDGGNRRGLTYRV